METAGVLLAGRGGARLLQILQVPLSRTSVLSRLMHLPLPPAVAPRVLGVDDFALYSDVYGTLLVDAGTRLPIELWAGRDAERLAAWLRGHTPVLTWSAGTARWSTDRASPTAPPTRCGSATASTCGRDCRSGSEMLPRAHRGCLSAAVPEPEAASLPASPAAPPDEADTPAHRHAKRLFEAVHAVTDVGRSLNSAARELGEHTATVLHEELVAKGYGGHYQWVKMAIAPLRRGLPIDTPRKRPSSPRQVTRWITTAPSRRDLHTTEVLRRLLDHCPELARTHDLVRQFAAMLDARDARPLARWLEQLSGARLPALASLANTIREDQPAVVQGITTPFDSGVNEGRITD